MNTKYILIGIAVSAVVTFTLRALPFVIFNGKRQMPEMLVKLGKVLPATIMAVLIVYCLKGGCVGSSGNWNTESCRRAGDRRNVQMEAQYAVKYSAGDCELYGDVAFGMRKREVEKFHSSEPLFLAVISAIGLRIICTHNPTIE